MKHDRNMNYICLNHTKKIKNEIEVAITIKKMQLDVKKIDMCPKQELNNYQRRTATRR